MKYCHRTSFEELSSKKPLKGSDRVVFWDGEDSESFYTEITLPFGLEIERDVLQQFWLDQWPTTETCSPFDRNWGFWILNQSETPQGLEIKLVIFTCGSQHSSCDVVLNGDLARIIQILNDQEKETSALIHHREGDSDFWMLVHQGRILFYQKEKHSQKLLVRSQEILAAFPNYAKIKVKLNQKVEKVDYPTAFEFCQKQKGEFNLLPKEQGLKRERIREFIFYKKTLLYHLMLLAFLWMTLFGFQKWQKMEMEKAQKKHQEMVSEAHFVQAKMQKVLSLKNNLAQELLAFGKQVPLDLYLDHFVGLVENKGTWQQIRMDRKGEFQVRLEFNNWDELEGFEKALTNLGPFKSLILDKKESEKKKTVRAVLIGEF